MTRRLFCLAALVAGLACSESLGPEDFYGVWGGTGVRLTLSNTQATFESSCWGGEIAIPIQVDGDDFEAVGTLNSQGGAGMSESRAATFSGHLSGDRLTLVVGPTILGLGPYSLHRNEQVQIPGCP
ncbi:hypothetical protein RHDC4_02691 [Rhodocyclaceae bacterium]|nr:hypothetical protein RHDC4_02691 [Rhodocyclaceae bacterium]